MTVPGGSPLNYPANAQPPIHRISRSRAPTANDYKNVREGDEWLDTSSMDWWKLADITGTVATWVLIGGTPGTLQTLTGDSGGAVSPDASHNIDILGTGSIVTTGDPGTNSITIGDSGDVATSYVTDSGTAVPDSNILNVLGGSNINTAGATDTITINLDDDIFINSATVTTFVTAATVNAGVVNVDPGATGDSEVHFDINSVNEFTVGVDDDDGDAFKISQGGALGTNDTFVMTADGERTLPLQPAFAAYLGTADTNVTGDGTDYMFGSGNALTEVFDRGGDFVTTGTFTAPVDGIYELSFALRLTNVTSGHLSGNHRITTSNLTWRTLTFNPFNCFGNGGGVGFTNHCLADMDQGDTATFNIQVSGSTQTVGVTATAGFSWCSGALYA